MGTRPRSSTIRRLAGSVAAVLTVVGMPLARADAPEAPVLWQGVVQSPSGGAAPATEVIAYARPPADRLGEGANSLVPVARATTDSQGRYALRAGHSDALRAAEDDAGWVTVMVSAMGPDGVTMAIDTIAWQPKGGIRANAVRPGDDTAGRWITTPAQQLRAGQASGEYRAMAADTEPEATGQDRPAVMVLPGNSPREPRFSAQAVPPPHTEGMCAGPYKSEDLGKNDVAVGELHLSSHWSGQFKYEQVRTTNFQVGVRPAGMGWSVGGSVSSVKGMALSHENPVLPENHMFTYRAEMLFKRFTWKCNYREEWHWVDTVEPVEWTGGMKRDDFGIAPGCNPKFLAAAFPNDKVHRQRGASTTMEGAISVIGFQGSATSTIASGVEQTWINDLPTNRSLCGDRGFPTGNTRVQSLA